MQNNRKIIYIAGFLFSIPIALTSYINSSFLEAYVDKSYIGILYAIASIITILGLFNMPKIISKIGNRLAIIIFCLFVFLSFLLLAFGNTQFSAVLGFITYFSTMTLVFASLDLFLEDFSQNYPMGKLRGIYLTVINVAWVLSEMSSGWIIEKSSFLGIYFLSAGIMVLVLLIFLFFLSDFKDPNYKRISLLNTIKIFKKNKYISKAYLINFLVKFFYAWMVIYMPIYLNQNIGFGWDKIGIIFGIMLIPFIILDYPLGRLSDKIGEKKMLIIGLSIMILSVFSIPFIKVPILPLWALVLFMTRIGAATVELMSESYFFKVIDKKECPNEISFFRNTLPFSYIIAPLLAIPILFIVPSLQYLFFILSAILFLGFIFLFKMKDIK